ncbi:HAD-IIA family hydrolase [Brachybacterium sp. JHP9]|uniref:HAD-IIA family hydrolase n=1 Tax=Brachybacterium equifaecis TaxID=2910770 RepID=A0ABT0R2B3_9MICO|nr:HAD-IIA family hydrolase [Brachybacterium equifaecis]MCL6423533.1 HAD-IIA family hydrolase [Brachybacterium equifaecis]
MTVPISPSLLDVYDALLLDLDGTLMHGGVPIPHAADGVRTARERGALIGFITNNASRTPDAVVAHLAEVGVQAEAHEVATSPQIAVQLLAQHVEEGVTVLVVGAESLASEVAGAGFTPVFRDSEDVAAVIQGFSPTLGWADLAEGCYALRRGVPWVATNTDATLPTERGMAPGNGSLVHTLVHATGRTPLVAGKPQPEMFALAAEKLGARRPLVVGDRLDTDIEGGNRAGMDTLLVLTGVDGIAEAVHAEPLLRPTWILPDLSTLTAPAPRPLVQGDSARCGASGARWDGEDIVLTGQSADPRALHAALALIAQRHEEARFGGAVREESGTVIAPPAEAPAP